MQNITQPFTNLSAANSDIIARFTQSPEMVELTNTSAQKYFELAQKSFGRVAASDAYADMVRRLGENYSTFAREYWQSLMGLASEGQSRMAQGVKEASDRVAQTGEAAVAALEDASDKQKHSRAR
jgi:hypothetical protein